MRYLFCIGIFIINIFTLSGQHLHFGTYGSYNKTAYQLTRFQPNQDFYSYGGRIAFGHENFQIGGEFDSYLSNPSFSVFDDQGVEFRKDEFSHNYYGALIRWNTSEVPAYRLGLVLKVGAGLYDSQFASFSVPDNQNIQAIDFSEKYLGLNGSIGFSGPIKRLFHWELHYQFDYTNIPELDTSIDSFSEFRAISHSIQFGVSMNFVFGEAAKRSKKIIDG